MGLSSVRKTGLRTSKSKWWHYRHYLHNDFIIQEIPDDDRHPQQQVLAVYNDAANAELAKQKRDDIARLLYRVNTKSVYPYIKLT